jgi:glyceraldehyde-3-phosphate dehydrogenase (NAD(P))
VVWKDSIAVVDGEVFVTQAIHQEAIVVPENIDAIRAMFELASKEESIKITNESLGIV